MTPLRRISILAASLGAVAVGLGWDLLNQGEPGLGPLQMEICGAGLAGILLASLPAPVRTPYARALLALTAGYLTAFGSELLLMPPGARTGRRQTSEQGMVRPSSWGGYELTPGWHGRSEDGVDSIELAINALGDRDDLPSPRDAAAAERVLLLGDSFTFGVGLQRSQTIEAQIENASGGRAVAYNLGVPGYGPGDTLAHYRERTAFSATHTVFLLYGNDLREDNCSAGFHTAVAGSIVARAKPSGAAYTRADVERELDAARAADTKLWRTQLKDALTLRELRGRLQQVLDRDPPLASGAPEQFTGECALAAAERSEEMRQIALGRGESFAVVILPSAAEAQAGRYFELMQLCIRDLERRSIPVIEVLQRLDASDYFRHHEHLNPEGARKVAQTILAALSTSRSSDE